MSAKKTLQEAMDAFVDQGDGLIGEVQADMCLQTLAQYLIHFSDLFQDPEMPEEADLADWEHDLEAQMIELLEGDLEPAADLGGLPLEALEPEHVRDFLGWFVLRETSDAELIEAYAEILRQFVSFVHRRKWWPKERLQEFLEVLAEVTPEAVRAARLSRVLYHYVRSGGGMSPRARGQRFSRFIEGHASVMRIDEKAIYLNFSHQGESIGPVNLPGPIIDMVAIGDVFDVELGLRGDAWVMLDIGPIYPACVYVEVEEFKGLEKIS